MNAEQEMEMNVERNMAIREVQNDMTKNGPRIRLWFIRHGETAGNLGKRYVGRTDEPLCETGRESVRRLLEGKTGVLKLFRPWQGDSPQSKKQLEQGVPRKRETENQTAGSFPASFQIYVSPMRRCLETAALLFPGMEDSFHIISDFRECDFGLFENRNYCELSGNEKLAPLYQAWIDNGGTLPFPEGESPDRFRKRCVRAFEEIMAREAGSPKDRHSSGDRSGRGHLTDREAPSGSACMYQQEGRKNEKTMVFVVHGGTIMSVLAAFGEPKKDYYDYQVSCAGGYVCDYLPGRGVITNIEKL